MTSTLTTLKITITYLSLDDPSFNTNPITFENVSPQFALGLIINCLCMGDEWEQVMHLVINDVDFQDKGIDEIMSFFHIIDNEDETPNFDLDCEHHLIFSNDTGDKKYHAFIEDDGMCMFHVTTSSPDLLRGIKEQYRIQSIDEIDDHFYDGHVKITLQDV